MRSKVLKEILNNCDDSIREIVEKKSDEILKNNTMENIKLTPQQAIEQGYNYYVYPNIGYQHLNSIADLDMDFERNPMVTEKEPLKFVGLDTAQIAELLADAYWEQWYEITGDDTSRMHDLFNEIDFSDIQNQIEEKLKDLQYYRQSNIELLKP